MTPELEALIARARAHKMTWQEKFQQRRSFAFGQMPDSYTGTRVEFDAMAREMHPEMFLDELFAEKEAEIARLRDEVARLQGTAK